MSVQFTNVYSIDSIQFTNVYTAFFRVYYSGTHYSDGSILPSYMMMLYELSIANNVFL